MPSSPAVTSGGVDAAAALGARIRAARNARNMTLRNLASQIGVSPATMSAVENGRTGISALRLTEVAQTLDITVDGLFSSPERTGGAVDLPGVLRSASEPRDWRAYPPTPIPPPLSAALEAFVDVGYHGATMRDIAGRAGLSVPGIYHHFASKQEMLASIHRITMEDLLWRTQAARDEGTDPVSRFRLLVECLGLFHTHGRKLGFIGTSEMRGLEPASQDWVKAIRVKIHRMLDEQVAEACASGAFLTPRPREASRAVVTMCTGIAQWFSESGPYTAEEVAHQHVEFALGIVLHHG